MKHLTFVILLFFFSLSGVSAQDLVNPDNPSAELSETRGYITINEFTGGWGLGDTRDTYSRSFFGITTIHGYQLSRNFILAAGTGALFYNGGTLVPLFIDLRFSFHTGAFTTYFFGDGGILFNTDSMLKLFINPGAGVSYPLNHHLALTFGTGIFVQDDKRRDSFVDFKVGVVFRPK